MTDGNEMKRQKAIARYKQKAVCRDLNLYSIGQFLCDMEEATAEVAYAQQDEEVFVEVLGEDEAFAFRMAFSALEADVAHFREDMEERWVPEDFDDFLCGMNAEDTMLGYDESEGDYFGFDDIWRQEEAVEGARTRLLRQHKKEDLLDAAGQCIRIALCYMALKTRFESLQDTLDIIRDKNENMLQITEQINAAYEKVAEQKQPKHEDEQNWQRLLGLLPQECWLR